MRRMLRAALQYAMPRFTVQRILSKASDHEAELDLLCDLVDPKREAIDVGANFGRYSKSLAALATKVWAFEPHPRLAYMLQRAMPPNVVVQQVAVSDREGETLLSVPVTGWRDAEVLGSVENSFAGAKTISVKTVALDHLADNNIGFCKIDVEGHEMSVLSGSSKLIENNRPIFVIEAEERHRPGAVKDLFSYFDSRDYGGLFIIHDEIVPWDRFTLKMQDPAALASSNSRKNIPYINNFIFIPNLQLNAALVQTLQMRIEAIRPQ